MSDPRYDPDDAAKPAGQLFTRQLSQRDLALSIPINFVEHVGIFLTPACFADNRYIQDAAQKCFSNLLAIGFHRYEVDVFWDVSRQLWSLCPVEMGRDSVPDEASSAVPSSTTAATRDQETEMSILSMTSEMDAEQTSTQQGGALRRQATATDSQLNGTDLPEQSQSPAATSDLSATVTSAPPSQTSSSGNGTYEEIGPYECSEAVTLDWLSKIVWSYLDTTETNLNATLRYLVLNVHAASSFANPSSSEGGLSGEDLPDSASSLSSVLASNLSSFLYTPADLREQRADINSTWYDLPKGMDPTPGYYSTRGAQDLSSTPDGWPTENYVEMSEGKRLLVGFGSIDSQMQGYDLSQDDQSIFPQGYLQDIRELSLGAAGEVTSGCFYERGQYAVSSVNNSWAFALEETSSQPARLGSASNITQCGVSPILNVTLEDKTADQDFLPYQTYLQSAIWAWAPGYPMTANTSAYLSEDDHELGNERRCAVLNASSGFWQNVDCSSEHYSACRRAGSIYDWSITPEDATYTKAGVTCREDSEFDVPRTGLQNEYLLNTWREYRATNAEDVNGDDLLWLNFNNLDSELCWVVGQNSTCPYVNRRSGNRQVIVPVVAAVVVFALGVLTIFVKCAANRQLSKRQKRRRRGDDGWDYEGVPS